MTRPLGKFEVYQRTRDGMFNATSLLAQWNKAKNSNKRIQDFFENQNTKDFIEALMEEENLKVPNLAYLKTRGKWCSGGMVDARRIDVIGTRADSRLTARCRFESCLHHNDSHPQR